MTTTVRVNPQLNAVTYTVHPKDRRRKTYNFTLSVKSHNGSRGNQAARWRKVLADLGWPSAAIVSWQKAFIRMREEGVVCSKAKT